MTWLLAVLVLSGLTAQAQTITDTFGSGANQFSIDFVQIGNPGNAADDTGFGSVTYIYNLGKYEISRNQIERANDAGNLGITMFDMDIPNLGGNLPNRPATGVSWNEAARFVNWLNTSKGYQVAYNFATDGPNDNIILWGAGQYIGANQFRHKDAYYFLPSLDEWYKGAYGSLSGIWYDYPTGSDAAPTAVSEGQSAETAVYSFYRPADIDFSGGESNFKTMGQGGNVSEWTESAWDGSNDSPTELRETRGGSWGSPSSLWLHSSSRNATDPINESGTDFGFRIAMVPEPSSLSLLVLGGAVLMAGRRRKRD